MLHRSDPQVPCFRTLRTGAAKCAAQLCQSSPATWGSFKGRAQFFSSPLQHVRVLEVVGLGFRMQLDESCIFWGARPRRELCAAIQHPKSSKLAQLLAQLLVPAWKYKSLKSWPQSLRVLPSVHNSRPIFCTALGQLIRFRV